MQSSIRKSILCAGLAWVMVLSAGCATKANPSPVSKPASKATSTESTKENGENNGQPSSVELAKAPEGFVSLLNIIDFGSNAYSEAEIVWPDGIPLGENPLTYNDGIYISGLEDDISVISQSWNIPLTAEKVAELPVLGDMYYVEDGNGVRQLLCTVAPGEDDPEPEEGTYASLADYSVMTRATPYNDTLYATGDASYIVFGLTNSWNPLPTRFDPSRAGRDGRDYAYAFKNGLYYSYILPQYDLEGYPEDAHGVTKYAYLESKLGAPSGVAWWTPEPSTIEEFSAMTNGTREYYLIWNYEKYSIATVCDEDFVGDDTETDITAICLLPRVTADGMQYINQVDSPMYYYGTGKLPALMGGEG